MKQLDTPISSNQFPCVVLIHGALHNHSVWRAQAQALKAFGYPVLAVDLPGHEAASPGPALPDVAACADWLLQQLMPLRLEHPQQGFALVGHSMGSLIALEAAARVQASADERLASAVKTLVLLGTACPMQVSPARLAQAWADPAVAIKQAHSYSFLRSSEPGQGAAAHEDDLRLMQALHERYAQAGHGNLTHHDFLLCDRYEGGLAAAATVRCPAMLILGEQDRMTPIKASAALAAALRAQVVTLPVGHSLMSEAPQGVLDALLLALAAPKPVMEER